MGTPTQYNPPWLWPAKENTRQHSYTGWVPFPGTKRKADDANSHEADYRYIANYKNCGHYITFHLK